MNGDGVDDALQEANAAMALLAEAQRGGPVDNDGEQRPSSPSPAVTEESGGAESPALSKDSGSSGGGSVGDGGGALTVAARSGDAARLAPEGAPSPLSRRISQALAAAGLESLDAPPIPVGSAGSAEPARDSAAVAPAVVANGARDASPEVAEGSDAGDYASDAEGGDGDDDLASGASVAEGDEPGWGSDGSDVEGVAVESEGARSAGSAPVRADSEGSGSSLVDEGQHSDGAGGDGAGSGVDVASLSDGGSSALAEVAAAAAVVADSAAHSSDGEDEEPVSTSPPPPATSAASAPARGVTLARRAAAPPRRVASLGKRAAMAAVSAYAPRESPPPVAKGRVVGFASPAPPATPATAATPATRATSATPSTPATPAQALSARSGARGGDRSVKAGDRLYAAARATQAKLHRQRQSLPEDYTFSPVLTKKALRMESTVPVGERLYARAVAHREQHEQRRQSLNATEGVTFKPKIKERHLRSREGGARATHERLYADHKRVEQARQQRVQEALAQHPYHPRVTDKAKAAEPRYHDVYDRYKATGEPIPIEEVDPECTFKPKMVAKAPATAATDTKPFVARMAADVAAREARRRQQAKAAEEARRAAEAAEAGGSGGEQPHKAAVSPATAQLWVEQQMQRDAARRARLAEATQRAESMPFKPHINKSSKTMMAERATSGTRSIFDRLLADVRQRRKRDAEVERAKREEFTFVPEVSQPLRRTAVPRRAKSSREVLAHAPQREAAARAKRAPGSVSQLRNAYGAEMKEIRRVNRRAKRRGSSTAEAAAARTAAIARLEATQGGSVYDRLYQDTFDDKVSGMRQMWDEIHAFKEKEECTFRPRTNAHTHFPRSPVRVADDAKSDAKGGARRASAPAPPSSTVASPTAAKPEADAQRDAEPFWERHSMDKAAWERLRRERAAREESRQLAGATFKPHVSRASRAAARTRTGAGERDIHEALYHDAKARAERRAHASAEAEARELAQLRAAPRTNARVGAAPQTPETAAAVAALRAAAVDGAEKKRGGGTSLRRGTFFGAFPTDARRGGTVKGGASARASPPPPPPLPPKVTVPQRTAADVRAAAEAAAARKRGAGSSLKRGSFFGAFSDKSLRARAAPDGGALGAVAEETEGEADTRDNAPTNTLLVADAAQPAAKPAKEAQDAGSEALGAGSTASSAQAQDANALRGGAGDGGAAINDAADDGGGDGDNGDGDSDGDNGDGDGDGNGSAEAATAAGDAAAATGTAPPSADAARGWAALRTQTRAVTAVNAMTKDDRKMVSVRPDISPEEHRAKERAHASGSPAAAGAESGGADAAGLAAAVAPPADAASARGGAPMASADSAPQPPPPPRVAATASEPPKSEL